MGRNFTPWKYKLGQHFGWLRVTADVHDHHASTYPNDPRLAATYLHSYNRADNGNLVTVYPSIQTDQTFQKHILISLSLQKKIRSIVISMVTKM